MADHFTLDVDPEAVRAVAHRLDRASEMLRRRGAKATATPGEIRDRWTGRAAVRVTAEMAALGGHLGDGHEKMARAVTSLRGLARAYDAALDQLPGLNRRWNDAVRDHAAALRDIARDQQADAQSRPRNASEQTEPATTTRTRTDDADTALATRQAGITGDFEQLRTELRRTTRRTGRVLAEAVLVQRPWYLPVGTSGPFGIGRLDWGDRARDELTDDLTLTGRHYREMSTDRTPPDDWRTYLRDYGLTLPATIDEGRGRQLVAALDHQLEITEDLDPGARSRAINRWASGLDPTDLSVLAMVDPERVGNLDGIPNPARYAANRVNLLHGIESEQAKLDQYWTPPPDTDHPQYAQYSRLTKRIEMLERLMSGDEVRDRDTGAVTRTPYQTLAFTPPTYDGKRVTDDARLAVVVGDLDSADHVGISVLGITNRIDNFGSVLHNAENVHDQVENSATIAWLGYDTPEFADAGSTADAEVGGEALHNFTEGLVRSRGSDLTIMAHSYGTLVTSQALQAGAHPDRVVLFGSPGLGENITSKGDFPPHVQDIPIYALRAPGDPVSITAGHGTDPVEMDGIIRLDTDWLGAEDVTGHSDYLTRGTDSLQNIAGVLRGDTVRPTGYPGPGRFLVTGGNALEDDGLAGPYNENLRALVDELQQEASPEQVQAFVAHLEPDLQNMMEAGGFDAKRDVPRLLSSLFEAQNQDDLGLSRGEFEDALERAGFYDKTGELLGDRADDVIDDQDWVDDLPIPIGIPGAPPIILTPPDGLNERVGDVGGWVTDHVTTNLSQLATESFLDKGATVLGGLRMTYNAGRWTWERAEDVGDFAVDRYHDAQDLAGDVADGLQDGAVDTYEGVRDSEYAPWNWG